MIKNAIRRVVFKAEHVDCDSAYQDIMLCIDMSPDCMHTELTQAYCAFLRALGYTPTKLEEFLEDDDV